MESQLNYGNWVRKRSLFMLGLATLAVGALVFIPAGSLYLVLVSIAFAVCLVSFLFPLYAYLTFSQKGGRFQEKVFDLIVDNLGADLEGKYLDIGSGNGVLAVKLAIRNRKAEVVGIDSWGTAWEYAKTTCERNAQIANVDNRVHFLEGDAASIGCRPHTFDGAVSNLTFHEVRSAPDKRAVLQEALRVIRPGGVFAFVDYFYESKYYGQFPDFQNYLGRMRLSELDVKPLHLALSMPRLLRHPRILGRVGIISGRK
jgi:SAM-dependent methyltransferase